MFLRIIQRWVRLLHNNLNLHPTLRIRLIRSITSINLRYKRLRIRSLHSLNIKLIHTRRVRGLRLHKHRLLAKNGTKFRRVQMRHHLHPRHHRRPFTPYFITIPIRHFRRQRRHHTMCTSNASRTMLHHHIRHHHRSLTPPLILLTIRNSNDRSVRIGTISITNTILGMQFREKRDRLHHIQSTILRLRRNLNRVLVTPRSIRIHKFTQNFFPVPYIHYIGITNIRIGATRRNIRVKRGTYRATLNGTFARRLSNTPHVRHLSIYRLTTNRGPTSNRLRIQHTPITSLIRLQRGKRRPSNSIHTLFGFTLNGNTINGARAIPPRRYLRKRARNFMRRTILFTPFKGILTTIRSTQRHTHSKRKQRHRLFIHRRPGRNKSNFHRALRTPLKRKGIRPHGTATNLLSNNILPTAIFSGLLRFTVPTLQTFMVRSRHTRRTRTLRREKKYRGLHLQRTTMMFFRLNVIPRTKI